MKHRYYSFVMFVALVFITTGGHAKDGPRNVSAGDMNEAVENFQGTWESVSVHRDGKPVEEQVGVRIAVRDREVKVTEGGFVDIGGWTLGTLLRVVHTTSIGRLNIGTTPAEIDMRIVSKDTEKAKTARGIYLLRDDVFKYCIAMPGKPRPKSFESSQNDGHTLVVMKRLDKQKSTAVELLDVKPMEGKGR